MTDVVLYSGQKGEAIKIFTMLVGEDVFLNLLRSEGPTERIPAVVSDADSAFLFSLSSGTPIELIVRVKDGS